MNDDELFNQDYYLVCLLSRLKWPWWPHITKTCRFVQLLFFHPNKQISCLKWRWFNFIKMINTFWFEEARPDLRLGCLKWIASMNSPKLYIFWLFWFLFMHISKHASKYTSRQVAFEWNMILLRFFKCFFFDFASILIQFSLNIVSILFLFFFIFALIWLRFCFGFA